MEVNILKLSLKKWHQMFESNDHSSLDDLLAEDVVFRSPIAFKPYEGKQVVLFILRNVIEVFQDFTYHRELYTENHESVVLEFSANVNNKSLKGIDMIRFDENGKIIEFEVMIRPMSGLVALSEHMNERIKKFQSN